MTSVLACSSESPISSNPLQNQEGTLGYLRTPDHLVRWHSAHLQGQFLTALNIPVYAVNFLSDLSQENLQNHISLFLIHFFQFLAEWQGYFSRASL